MNTVNKIESDLIGNPTQRYIQTNDIINHIQVDIHIKQVMSVNRLCGQSHNFFIYPLMGSNMLPFTMIFDIQ